MHTKHPWDRDNEDYTVLNTVLLALLCALLLFAGFITLKHERKVASQQITFTCSHNQWEAGECEPETQVCYRMTDGKAVCP